MKWFLILFLSLFILPSTSYALSHDYVDTDWLAGTHLNVVLSGPSITFTTGLSLVGDDTSVYPLYNGTTYYIVFSSTGTTGSLQFQASNGASHQTFGHTNTDTQITLVPTATSYLQIGGGTTNWSSDTDSQITAVCISNVSHNECLGISPTPTPNNATTTLVADYNTNFGLGIIVVLLFLMFCSMIWNSLSAKKQDETITQ